MTTMRSAFVLVIALCGFASRLLADASAPPPAPLRVCADPDNLPFSHRDGSGFENRIAQLAAEDLKLPLAYEWLPDRRGFVRKTLGARLCDVIIGVPVGFERAATTRPYYRSSYVFVERDSALPPIRSLGDPRLARMRIGVQLIGNDLAASPPGYVLARQGHTQNVLGYPVPGEQPAAQRAVAAVADGALDGAVLWGPQAGYFASRSTVPMRVAIVAPPASLAALPFEYSIAMGVRRADGPLRELLDDFIRRRQGDIDRILAGYSVPRVAGAAQ